MPGAPNRLLLAFVAATIPVAPSRAQERSVDERLANAIVRVVVDDRARLRTERLLVKAVRDGEQARELPRLRIRQPYQLVLSGIVISASGEILTPALHPGADLEISVTLHDGRRFAAELVGTDPPSNIALLRIPSATPDFLALQEQRPERMADIRLLGPCADLRERADPCTLPGFVGQLERPVWRPDLYSRRVFRESLMAVITEPWKARAGSACIDKDGRLVGMMTDCMLPGTIRDPARPGGLRVIQGHFVVPAERITRVLSRLREHGRVIRSWFGVRIAAVPDVLRAHFDLPASAAEVTRVLPGHPGARAGLRPHDVILRMAGKHYRDAQQLFDEMWFQRPGRPVRFDLLRAGKRISLEATPDEMR